MCRGRGPRVRMMIHMICFVAASHVSERVCLRSKKDMGTMTFVRVYGRVYVMVTALLL